MKPESVFILFCSAFLFGAMLTQIVLFVGWQQEKHNSEKKRVKEIHIGDRVRYERAEKEFIGEIVGKSAGSSVRIKWDTGFEDSYWSGFLRTRDDDGYIKMFYHSLDGEYPS